MRLTAGTFVIVRTAFFRFSSDSQGLISLSFFSRRDTKTVSFKLSRSASNSSEETKV